MVKNISKVVETMVHDTTLSDCVATLQISNKKLSQVCSAVKRSNQRFENQWLLKQNHSAREGENCTKEKVQFLAEEHLNSLLENKRNQHLAIAKQIVEVIRINVDSLQGEKAKNDKEQMIKYEEKQLLEEKLEQHALSIKEKESELGRQTKKFEELNNKAKNHKSREEKRNQLLALLQQRRQEKQELLRLVNSSPVTEDSLIDVKSKRLKMIKNEIGQYKQRAELLETVQPSVEASTSVQVELEQAREELLAAIENKSRELKKSKELITSRKTCLEKLRRHMNLPQS